MRSHSDSLLGKSRCQTVCTSWQDYFKEKWTTKSERADLLLTDRRESIPLEEKRAFSQFCRGVLKSGSYVFLFVSFENFKDWKDSFQAEGFKTMNFPYVVLYKKNSIQRRAVSDFPQHHFDPALLANTPGIHPSGFKPKFNDAAPTLEIDETPRYASAVNVDSCGSKLTKPNLRAPICPAEKNPDLLMYVWCIYFHHPAHMLLTSNPGQCIPYWPALSQAANVCVWNQTKLATVLYWRALSYSRLQSKVWRIWLLLQSPNLATITPWHHKRGYFIHLHCLVSGIFHNFPLEWKQKAHCLYQHRPQVTKRSRWQILILQTHLYYHPTKEQSATRRPHLWPLIKQIPLCPTTKRVNQLPNKNHQTTQPYHRYKIMPHIFVQALLFL